MRKVITQIIYLVALVVFTMTTASANTLFEQAKTAFKNGDYEIAAIKFKEVLLHKKNTPLIHYNLASSYYKLARYQDAHTHFLQAAKSKKLSGLAYYNLGLVSVLTENNKQANHYFQLAYSNSKNSQVKSLAKKQLDKLGSPPKEKNDPLSNRFTAYFNLAYNYDDNISNANEDLPNEILNNDYYYDFYGQISYKLTDNAKSSNKIKLGSYISRYDEFTDYDQTQFNIGFYHKRKLTNWNTRLGVHAYRDKIGDVNFQQRIKYQIRGDLKYAERQRLRLQYQYYDISELDNKYEHLSGSRHRAKLENRSSLSSKYTLTVGYKYEHNDRNDFSTTSSFTSYSPIRHSIYSKLKIKFNSQWRAKLNISYRNSDYQKTDFTSTTVRGVREDNRFKTKLNITYKLNSNTEIETSYSHTNNDSNFDSKSYTTNAISLGINLLYF